MNKVKAFWLGGLLFEQFGDDGESFGVDFSAFGAFARPTHRCFATWREHNAQIPQAEAEKRLLRPHGMVYGLGFGFGIKVG